MGGFVVCCPSYKRPKVETLDIYPHTRVYVAESELAAYQEENQGADICAVPDAVQGNLCRVRNYILDSEFSGGRKGVVIIDDDMKSIGRFNAIAAERGVFGYERETLDEKALYEFIEHGFCLCDEFGYKLWGLNCVDDPKAYMQYTPFNTIKYIGGPFQAHISNPIRYDERLPLKEDYDITLQHLKEYGGVLKFNAYHYRCKQAEQTGGCASYRTLKAEKKQFELLQKKWGSKIVTQDNASRRGYDFNPILRTPIKGA